MKTSHQFKNLSSLTGISATNAEQITRNPDQSGVITLDVMTLRLFTKRVASTKPPSHVLVAVIESPGKAPVASLVAKVYDDFAENIKALPPAEFLLRFAEQFGYDMKLGNETRRLFLGERLVVNKPPPPDVLVTGEGMWLLFDFKAGKIPGSQLYSVSVLLGLAVDPVRYGDYVRGRGRLPS